MEEKKEAIKNKFFGSTAEKQELPQRYSYTID